MKLRTNTLYILILCCCLFVMILNPKTALLSAGESLNLCIMTVIPGLFPFLFLSSAIASELQRFRAPILERLLKIPSGAAGYFIIGLLCGYPVGAKMLQDGIDRQSIDKNEAVRMMSFCNNASPAFIIGMLASIFSSGTAAITMWLIQIVSSIILARLLRNSVQINGCSRIVQTQNTGSIMHNSLKSIGTICGWVIIFGVLIGYLNPFVSELESTKKVLLFGLIELTNGISGMTGIISSPVRFMVSAVLLSFGGVCVLLQTKSLAPDIKLSNYIYARMTHAAISGVLASISCGFLFPASIPTLKPIPLFLCVAIICVFFHIFNKKR